MKKAIVGVIVIALVTMSQSKAENPTDRRMRLLLTTIETPDTRTDKIQQTPMPPMESMPYSDAALATLSGDALLSAQALNNVTHIRNLGVKAKVLWDNYQQRLAKQKEIVERTKGTIVGRNLLLLRDWFAGSLSQYNDVFVFIFRADAEEAQRESFYSNADPTDVETSSFFVKLIVADPKQTSRSIITQGGAELKKTTTTQLMTVHVQDMRDELVFSKNVEVSSDTGSSSSVMTSGDADVFGKVARQCLDQVAKELAENFSTMLTIRIKGRSGDDDFEEDEASIYLNGKSVSASAPIRVPRGEHAVTVEMDGYETMKRNYTLNESVVTKTIVMKRENVGTSQKSEE